ncbi:hypothetical protein [Sulfobacillus harzensis]|uniref:DUF4352 domain-containing protein n=1 Tax=Sulfobacillus harzensis TaxID=2729629 RepID=A0A7Y0L3D2_9FIRM|nr:hypothetical protein [Sulfobacillus harzensis]NMP22538.1 hypothetical protein [Sulfobacillus harzensis]
MTKQLVLWGSMALILAGATAGCGHQANISSGPHHPKHHQTQPTPSPTANTTSSTAPPTSSSTPVSVSQSSSTPAPSVSIGTGGGVGGTNGLRATVLSVTAEGQVNVNGSTDNLYLIRLSLKNMTTSVIPFALNDVSVVPSGSQNGASRNDYSLKGVTQQNSLFPYPIVPQHASAVDVMVQSNQTATGVFTVEVPPASRYAIRVSGSASPIATFTE